jgi:alpha-N-arabinofuranosidase
MAAVAQLVNCLQSLFLAHEDKFCLTPTYHVFDMFAAHQGARSVRTLCGSPSTEYSRNGTLTTMRGLNGSASLNAGQLTLTVTNPSLDQTREAEIQIHGGTARSVTGVVLAAADPHAHNTFEDPHAVEPKAVAVTLRGGGIIHQFPAASVTKLTVTLG